MKTYQVSTTGRLQAGGLLFILALIFLYSARKALGLWNGSSAKPSDPQLFWFNLNTTVPAFLLTLVAVSCLAITWYILTELFSQVQVDENGILLRAPGYRLYYQWDKIAALDVLQEPEEDTTACLRLTLAPNPGAEPKPVSEETVTTAPDEISAYLSEVDQPAGKTLRRRQRETRRQLIAQVRAKVTRPDGRSVPPWLRLIYPQVSRPDCILLYPSLAERPALISEIEQHLSRA